MDYTEFQTLIKAKGHELYRDMPWRNDTQPYYILVSELMLQQTQVDRVVPKFNQFIQTFPDEQALSFAPLSEVLKQWQGLGYNRRAKYLQLAARSIAQDFNGKFPNTADDLMKLPGVGPNTSGAILAYAFNQPALFIETNIRTVFIHHFFADDFGVSDTQIRGKLDQTLDRGSPRQFYWSLMDYGSYLKKSGVKNNRQAKDYKKQSPLKGSLREARGIILKYLSESDLDVHDFRHDMAVDDRYDVALEGLVKDGLVVLDKDVIRLSN